MMIESDRILFSILGYYKERELAYPDAKEALDFAVTEMGEAMDAWIRENQKGWTRNNDREANFGFELGDIYQMLEIASFAHTGRSLFENLKEKWKTKGFDADEYLQTKIKRSSSGAS